MAGAGFIRRAVASSALAQRAEERRGPRPRRSFVAACRRRFHRLIRQSVTRIGERSRPLSPEATRWRTGLRRVRRSTVGDRLFLIGWGLAMLTAAWVYGATGWAVPVLINKSED